MKKNKALLLSAVSGILISFSYIPFSPIVGLISLVPLWMAIDTAKSYKQVFLYSWIAQFLFSIIGFHWIATTAHDFGYMPWSLSILILIAFSCLVHLHFCIAAILYRYLQNKWQLSSLGSDFLKLGCFFVSESYWPMIFPWNFGYTWITSSLPVKQTAEIWGFVGISFFSILANVVFKQVVELRATGQKQKAKKLIFTFLGSFAAICLLGISLKSSLIAPDKTYKVGVVQANIGNFDKVQAEFGAGFQEKIINKYLELSKKLVKEEEKIDFLVWPETAIPISMESWNRDNYLYKQIYNGIKKMNVELVSGSFLADTDTYNGAISMNAAGEIEDSYRKSLLLAFGETVPGTSNFPELQKKLKKLVPALSFFGRGDGAKPISLSNQLLGVNICYEAIHPTFMSDYKNQGAKILINLTNDSWFGQTFEPYQHLYMTLARAIELRVPLVRSTNTGISTVIQANGDIETLSPIGKEWFHVFEVHSNTNPASTLYQHLAVWIPLIFLVILAVSILLVQRASARNKTP